MNFIAVGIFSLFGLASGHQSQRMEILPLVSGVENRLHPNAANVSADLIKGPAFKGIQVTIKPGSEGYPGVSIKPLQKAWDFSKFGDIEANVTNTGKKPLMVALRVDNVGEWQTNPWNTESATIPPGASESIKTIFGYSYGYKRGFDLKPNEVVNVMLFCLKSDDVQSFRINSIVAAGPAGEKPPVAPDDVRTKPFAGQLTGQTSKTAGTVIVRPAQGRWDLRDCLEVQVDVRNSGKTPVVPRARLTSNGGPTDWISLGGPLAIGAKGTITIPFGGKTPYVVGKTGTGSLLTSDAVSTIELTSDPSDSESPLSIESIRAGMPANQSLPSWLGKRPPVPGEWVKTLDDEFDGVKLNTSTWDVYGENYYDKVTHWTKNGVIVGGGVVKLRYEKKVGFQNDDPKRTKSGYAAGYLQTYDKWAQRYGYFEARMKLPKSPGLWPAFWMMPDRGDKSKPQYERQATEDGGMEFDIMEHLTRWGPNRYNIAMHYDGYQAAHKAVGSDRIYVQPDKDGFLTCGLLWTPGSAIFYCNGREVLRWENPRISNVSSYFLFTIPSGGWDNNALDDAQLPADVVIDYVRVWQRKDLSER